MITYISQ